MKPWDTPPRQKMFLREELLDTIKEQRYWLKGTELEWFYIPYHHFYIHYHRRFKYHMIDWNRKDKFGNFYNAVRCG